MEEIRKNISQNITKLRTNAKLTQAELAERLAYSDKSVSKWERGEAVPDIYVLSKIAELFDVNVDYLLHHHSPESKPATRGEIAKHNHLIISLISLLGLLIVVTVAFVAIWATSGKVMWISYIIALPIALVLMLVFNSLWFDRKNNFYIISLLIWSLLTAIYLSLLVFGRRNLWLIFVIGIPAQIVTILSFDIVPKNGLRRKARQ